MLRHMKVMPRSVCAADSGGYLADVDCSKMLRKLGQASGEGLLDLFLVSKGKRVPVHRLLLPVEEHDLE